MLFPLSAKVPWMVVWFEIWTFPTLAMMAVPSCVIVSPRPRAPFAPTLTVPFFKWNSPVNELGPFRDNTPSPSF